MRIKRTERPTILGANWQLAKTQELHAPGEQPGRPYMHERQIRRKGGEKYQCCLSLIFDIKASPSRIAPASAAAWWMVAYFRRADFDFFVRFDNAASYIDAQRHASSRQLCLLACVVVLWSERPCFGALSRADCALLRCVCGRCSADKNTSLENEGPSKKQWTKGTRLVGK